jgi:hypothetical protein
MVDAPETQRGCRAESCVFDAWLVECGSACEWPPWSQGVEDEYQREGTFALHPSLTTIGVA